MASPLISIIIPTYNREHCVRQSLDSVLAQTFTDYELIVIDDGSSDGTVEILKSYGDKIRLICQKNAGAGAARNTGIRVAQGKYIAFLDSDDHWRPEKLAVQMAAIVKYGAKVCCSRCVGENGEPLRDIEEVAATLKEPGIYHVPDPVEFCSRARCHPYLQSMVLEKELFNIAGLFDQALHTGDDTVWFFRLGYVTDCIYIDQPMTVIFRGSDNSLTYDVRPASAEKRWSAFIRMQAEMYWRFRQSHPAEAKLVRGRLGYTILCRAELACAAGDFALARSLAWDAVTCAAGFKAYLHVATLLLVPALVRGRFRKKWYRK
ncbi:MAG TPA: glycosyltransferase family 2 protein [Verrucomicrobiae bacterium]|nr:glycosyltransferase family 2 protein [Verrucomicrobiae bacterium]